MARLLFRWSVRDLRRRWLVVLAISLVIATGTATYAALGSTSVWRRASNDASFGLLHMHDLHVSLGEDSVVPAGQLQAVVSTLPHAAKVTATEERLVVPTQVEAVRAGKHVLVPGRLVGVPVPGQLDRIHVAKGRALQAADGTVPAGILEEKFAAYHRLPPTGTLTLSGGRTVPYVGTGVSPEYFRVQSETGDVFSVANLGVVFMPINGVQTVAGRPGAVNDLVLTLKPGVSADAMKQELERALAERLPTSAATVETKADNAGYRLLYQDIDNDQRFWNIIAFLILGAAAFASFNLVTRMVEAQRREIGVGMALGVPPRTLAIRPMLLACEIAVLGALAGLGIGYLLDAWLRDVFMSVLPLPVWKTPFQLGTFLRASALGIALPVLAAAIPVRRAVRVEPVEAIRVGHLGGRGRLAPALLRVLRLPGNSIRQLPLRNLVRTPRRTILTALGIAAAIVSLLATIGLIDSFSKTVQTSERELTRRGADRIAVQLDRFYPIDSPVIRGIASSGVAAEAVPEVRLPATARANGKSLDLLVDAFDFGHALWTPTVRGSTGTPGIVLADKAAADLGVVPGDSVSVRLPVQADGAGFRLVDVPIQVAGTHPNPLRPLAYVDTRKLSSFGTSGTTNLVEVRPAAGTSADQGKDRLFRLAGVASVQAVRGAAQSFQDALKQFFDVLRVMELIALVLALLIAFNSASLSTEERARENATMFAFGLRPRSVLRAAAVEAGVTGLLGTVIGVIGGYLVVRWSVEVQLERTVPDLRVSPYLSMGTLITAVVIGVVVVAASALLTAPRLRRMDIPSTLRVVE